MVNLNTIKNWFKTGLKPTQQQFWDTWDSFWHKDDNIPVAKIDGIDNLLNQKANKSVLDSHLTDENAHADLFAKIRFIPHGELLVFEPEGKAIPGVLTAGDYCQGYVEGEFINANYLGGDKTLLASYDI